MSGDDRRNGMDMKMTIIAGTPTSSVEVYARGARVQEKTGSSVATDVVARSVRQVE